MDIDKEILVIFERYASEVKEEKMRAKWNSLNYDGVGMQDRLSPIWQIGKVCMISLILPAILNQAFG
jgi:hypothetical protein